MLRPAIILSVVAVVLTVFSTLFFTRAVSLAMNSTLLFVFVSVLIFFMLSTIYSVSKRGILPVALFSITNIACIITLFGNVFRYSGIRSTTSDLANQFPIYNSIYFSAVTWTTVGYGDIIPSHNSRAIAAFEALTGYLVMALTIAVLLSMVQSDQARTQTDIIDRIYRLLSAKDNKNP